MNVKASNVKASAKSGRYKRVFIENNDQKWMIECIFMPHVGLKGSWDVLYFSCNNQFSQFDLDQVKMAALRKVREDI